jgi:hypothetical protein
LFSLRLEAPRTEKVRVASALTAAALETVLNTLPHFIIPTTQVFNFSENLPWTFAH